MAVVAESGREVLVHAKEYAPAVIQGGHYRRLSRTHRGTKGVGL